MYTYVRILLSKFQLVACRPGGDDDLEDDKSQTAAAAATPDVKSEPSPKLPNSLIPDMRKYVVVQTPKTSPV